MESEYFDDLCTLLATDELDLHQNENYQPLNPDRSIMPLANTTPGTNDVLKIGENACQTVQSNSERTPFKEQPPDSTQFLTTLLRGSSSTHDICTRFPHWRAVEDVFLTGIVMDTYRRRHSLKPLRGEK